MQWLIDIVLESLKGIIVMWSGAIVDIPTGWQLCDGTNGTTDLRDKFIVGAGNSYAVNDNGGAINHAHDFTSNPHFHDFSDDEDGGWSAEGDYVPATASKVVTGTTDPKDGRPPYYAKAYIQKV